MQTMVGSVKVYAHNDLMCVSNGSQHQYLPRTFCPWSQEVYFDRETHRCYLSNGADTVWVDEYVTMPEWRTWDPSQRPSAEKALETSFAPPGPASDDKDRASRVAWRK